jgi:hypothetical protein
MKRVPYDARKNILLLMLREEELKLDDFYKKAYFITGHMRMRTLNSYIKVMKEIICDSNGTVRLDVEKCPVWLQYALYIKQHGTVTTSELARAFGHPQPKVHNEMHRYMDLFNIGRSMNKNTYELKEGITAHNNTYTQ